jgi:tetratricopeptide (TPR) repeat protein
MTDVCQRCVEPLAEIAELHRGAFLEGFALRDSPEYDDWQFFTAEELQRELADALSRLVEARVRTGDLELATQAARRRLALDPLHEPAHRILMRLYAWQGRREAGLRQYRECVRVLQSELGVSPLDETNRLYEDMLANRVAGPPAVGEPASPHVLVTGSAAPSTASGTRRLARRLVPAGGEGRTDGPATARGRPQLVGRERELAALSNAITRIHTDGVVVVVEGEAGIGKTRLLDELATSPVIRGRAVLSTACRQDETGLAYGVVVELLRAATGTDPKARPWLDELRRDVLREVGRLLPEVSELAGPPLPPDGPGAAWRLVDALATALVVAVSEGDQPGVLIVDDVHWADESSLDVLSHLARRLQGRPACLVLAWRTELVGRGHRLRRLVADLARQQLRASERETRGGPASPAKSLVRQVPLARLDLAAVRALLDDVLGADRPDADTLAGQVMDTTEGVPLLVVEYLAALARDPAALHGPPPQGAQDLLLARLSAVGPEAQQILATAAVIGRSFDPDLVRRASGRAEEETAEALDELTAAGLIAEPTQTGGYDFTHSHLRALAYRAAGLARQRLLHRRVAAALESRVRHQRADRSLAASIAAHYAAAGDEAAAATWFARAAEHAAALLAVSEAVAHYEEALALGHDEPQRIHEALGDLQTLAGRYGEALERYEAAAALADEERFAVLEHKIAGVHLRWGRWVLADQHLAIALSALEERTTAEATALRARVLTDRGLVAHREGHDHDAAALARAALEAAGEANDLGALAGAHNLLGVLSKHDLSLARHHLEHALALARRLHDVGIEVAAANNLAQAHAAAGALDRALPLAESALARAGQLADRHREAALRNNLADLLRAAGRNEEAMIHLKRAVALFAEIGEPDEHAPEIWKLAAW